MNALDYLQKYDDNFTSVKETTKIQTYNVIEKLRKNLKKKKNINFLNKSDKIIEYLSKTFTNSNTKKSYYIGLVSFLSKLKKKTPTQKRALEAYTSEMEKNRNVANDKKLDNIKTITNKENEKIFDLISKQLKDDTRSFNDVSREEPSSTRGRNSKNKQMKDLKNLLMSKLLILSKITTRADYGDITLINDSSFNPKAEPTQNNIVIKGQNAYLVLSDFKNVCKVGKIVLKYEPFLSKDIISFYDFMTNEFPFLDEIALNFKLKPTGDYKGIAKSSRNMFSKDVIKLVGFGINELRHIKVSKLIEDPSYSRLTNRQKGELHKFALHSTATALSEYNRV